jgi:hypothetical protein
VVDWVAEAPGGDELGAFRACAEVYPDDGLLLLDTIETLDSGLDRLRERCREDIDRLHPRVGRLLNPHVYHVSPTERLHGLKQRLVEEASSSRIPGTAGPAGERSGEPGGR